MRITMLDMCVGGYTDDVANNGHGYYNQKLSCCPDGGFFTGSNPVNRVTSRRTHFITNVLEPPPRCLLRL